MNQVSSGILLTAALSNRGWWMRMLYCCWTLRIHHRCIGPLSYFFFSFIAVVQVQRDKTEKEEEVFTLQPPSCTLGRIVKSWTDTKHFNITNKTELTSRTLKQCDERRKRKRKREHKVQDDKRVFKPVICFLVDVGDISLSMQVKHFLMSVNWNIAFGLLLLYINNKKQSCMCSVPLFVWSQPEIKF